MTIKQEILVFTSHNSLLTARIFTLTLFQVRYLLHNEIAALYTI